MNFELYCSKRIFILLLSNYVNIVLIVYFAIFQKLIFQFFIKFKAQGQIKNLLVMRIPKLLLIVKIDDELTEGSISKKSMKR